MDESKPFVRMCAMCQREFPAVDKAVRATQNQVNFSHGYCQRHALEMYKTIPGMTPEKLQQAAAKLSSNPDPLPDLGQRPDLVKAYSHGIFSKEQAAQAHQQLNERKRLKKLANIKG